MAQSNAALDIKTTLVADGVYIPIFVGSEPPKPDDVITLYNTVGATPNPKFLLDEPTIQLRIRSGSYNTAYTNLLGVFNLLHGRPAFTVTGTRYVGLIATSNIFEIGKDEKDRTLLAFNMRLIVEPALGTQHRQSI